MTIRKGQVLNPEGKNSKKPISEAIKLILTRPAYDALNDKPKTIAQKIALNLVKAAMIEETQFTASKEVMDRVEGKPAQAVDVGGQEDNPVFSKLVVELVRAKD